MSRTRNGLVPGGIEASTPDPMAALATCTGTDDCGGAGGATNVRPVHREGVPDTTANRAEVPRGDDAD